MKTPTTLIIMDGFGLRASEAGNAVRNAPTPHLDLIAANNLKDPGAGFGVSTNLLTLISPDDMVELPLMSKEEAAHALLDHILSRRG